MKKKLIAIVLVVLVLGAGIGGYEVTARDHHATKSTVSNSQTKATGTIQFTPNRKQVTYTGITGRTALQNLQALTSVGTTDTSYGRMVVSINGVSAIDGKTYWAFYVNGAYANEGASTYITRAGDKLMWKLEDITQ